MRGGDTPPPRASPAFIGEAIHYVDQGGSHSGFYLKGLWERTPWIQVSQGDFVG